MRGIAILAAGAVSSAWVAAAPTAPSAPTITLQSGQQKSWVLSQPVRRAATANNDIVGINVVPPRGVVITAKKPGTAMVSVWQRGGDLPASVYQVVVTPASVGARATLGPDAPNAQIATDGTKLRLSGTLSSLEGHATAESALTPAGQKTDDVLVDATTTNFDVQVRMDIKIVEVSRQKLKEAGFYYQRHDYRPDGSYAGSTGFSNPNNYAGITSDTPGQYKFLSNSGTVPFTDAFNIFSVSNNVWAAFSALEANGFAYSLAEPSLTALSGQTASFLAGGEVPIPIRASIDGSITITYKEFGIRLSLTPTVLDQHRMTLRVAPEVSEIDTSLGVQSGGYSVPGLRVRRTDTTVAMADGETFVISGLVSHASSATIDKFPFLGDIPILGAFFKSDRFEKNDKELLMIATPHLVRPFARNAQLPALPGEDIRKYDPGFMHLFLKERGRFEQPDSGFSE